jgi:hypothetical protein
MPPSLSHYKIISGGCSAPSGAQPEIQWIEILKDAAIKPDGEPFLIFLTGSSQGGEK